MKYMLVIYGDPDANSGIGQADVAELFEAHGKFGAMLAERGAMLGGEGLQSPETATTVRHQGERVLVTDGPFAETKEVLGGFYLVEAKDLDEAIEFAKQCPAPGGCVEVRPVLVY